MCSNYFLPWRFIDINTSLLTWSIQRFYRIFFPVKIKRCLTCKFYQGLFSQYKPSILCALLYKSRQGNRSVYSSEFNNVAIRKYNGKINLIFDVPHDHPYTVPLDSQFVTHGIRYLMHFVGYFLSQSRPAINLYLLTCLKTRL